MKRKLRAYNCIKKFINIPLLFHCSSKKNLLCRAFLKIFNRNICGLFNKSEFYKLFWLFSLPYSCSISSVFEFFCVRHPREGGGPDIQPENHVLVKTGIKPDWYIFFRKCMSVPWTLILQWWRASSPNLSFLLRQCYKGFFLIFLLFSFSVFSDEGGICDVLDPWKLPVCAETEEGLIHVSNTLHTQLEASLIRKKVLPEKVIKAGQAVFKIGIQFELREWNWGFRGGSGFFMLDTRTFFTAYHVLEPFLDRISHLNEIVFKDQTGTQYDFEVKGVKFASRLHDIVILEIEGYDGPVLRPSIEPPQEQSYIIGYSPEFKIQSVSEFKATDIYHGAFVELFDCYYAADFGGSSGGAFLNQSGEVEGVFTTMMGPSVSFCGHFLLARRLDFLAKGMDTVKIYDSVEAVKDLMDLEEHKTIALVVEGNMDARYDFLGKKPSLSSIEDITEAIESAHPLMLHALMQKAAFYLGETIDDNLWKKTWNKITAPLNREKERLLSFLNEEMIASEPQRFLPVTWYERGVIAYYADEGLERACDFWDKARQTGHPFVLSDLVIIPRQDIVQCEF